MKPYIFVGEMIGAYIGLKDFIAEVGSYETITDILWGVSSTLFLVLMCGVIAFGVNFLCIGVVNVIAKEHKHITWYVPIITIAIMLYFIFR